MRTAAIAWILLLHACDKKDAPAPTPPPAPAPADKAVAEAEPAKEDACRDWSDLDPGTLPALPKTPYSATFDHAWRTILTKHFDRTLNCKDWPALRAEYGQKLKGVESQSQAYGVMNQMLGELEQSHLGIVPPMTHAAEPREGVLEGSAQVPVTVRYIDGQVVIVDNAAHDIRSGLPGGAAILEVDGRKVDTVLAYNKEHYKRDAWISFQITRAVMSWLSCPKGAKKKVVFQPAGSTKPKTKTVPCREPKLERVTMGNLKNVPVFVEHRMLRKSKVGYVAFNVWLVPLMPKIEAAIAELRGKGMKSLIIDLRGNPGGVGMMVVPLARQVLSESASLGEMRLRDSKQVFNVTAQDGAFTGPIAILIDALSVSTSEIFAQAMQDIGRVQVFGSGPTPGAALPSLIEELPGGALLQYVVADYQSPKGVSVEGRGVIPDVKVSASATDFANGRDPVLDAAAAALQTPAKG